MKATVPKPCLVCGIPTTDGSRCLQHQTRNARGYGRDYQTLRALVLAGSPRCWICGAPATTADHVPPLRTAPTPDQWRGELKPACHPCNSGHRKPTSTFRDGPSVADDPSGLHVGTTEFGS